jgi:hypothetical protein
MTHDQQPAYRQHHDHYPGARAVTTGDHQAKAAHRGRARAKPARSRRPRTRSARLGLGTDRPAPIPGDPVGGERQPSVARTDHGRSLRAARRLHSAVWSSDRLLRSTPRSALHTPLAHRRNRRDPCRRRQPWPVHQRPRRLRQNPTNKSATYATAPGAAWKPSTCPNPWTPLTPRTRGDGTPPG